MVTIHSSGKTNFGFSDIETSHWVQVKRKMKLLEEQVAWVWIGWARLLTGLVKDMLLGCMDSGYPFHVFTYIYSLLIEKDICDLIILIFQEPTEKLKF